MPIWKLRESRKPEKRSGFSHSLLIVQVPLVYCIWPKKKQGYGYHDRSPSIKKNLSKSLRVSGAFKHPKYAGVVNGIAFLIENDDSFIKTKLFLFFFPKKSRSDGPTSHLQQRTLPAVRSSLNYSVMQYLLNTKNKMHFDPMKSMGILGKANSLLFNYSVSSKVIPCEWKVLFLC